MDLGLFPERGGGDCSNIFFKVNQFNFGAQSNIKNPILTLDNVFEPFD